MSRYPLFLTITLALIACKKPDPKPEVVLESASGAGFILYNYNDVKYPTDIVCAGTSAITITEEDFSKTQDDSTWSVDVFDGHRHMLYGKRDYDREVIARWKARRKKP